MIKLLILSFTFLSNIVNDFIIKIDPIESEIIEFVEDSYLIKLEDNYEIRKNDLIIYTTSCDNLITYTYLNNFYYVVVTNETSKLLKIDKNGTIYETLELKNQYEEINISLNNNLIYLYGSISSYSNEYLEYKKDYMDKNDSFIQVINLDLDEVSFRVYGGKLNEGFEGIKFCEEQLVLFGYKDELSGGDFGNGGSNLSGLLVILSLDLDLINYIVFEDLIYDINISRFYTIITNKGIIVLNDALCPVNSIEFESVSTFGGFMNNESLYILNDLGLNIYEKDSLGLVFYQEIEEEYNYVVNNNHELLLLGEFNHKMRIYDLRLFKPIRYHGFIYYDEIYGINSKLSLNDIKFLDYFDSQICGDYQVKYDFGEVLIDGVYKVIEEENVSDDMIYPLGYRLLFTGTAYLNGKLISNNHAINNAGTYKLEIYDLDGNSREYGFVVEGSQMDIEEISYTNWDISCKVGEQIKLDITSSANNLKGVYGNNQSYEYFKSEEGYYVLISYDEVGLKKFDIDYLEYEQDSIIFKEYVNLSYLINVSNSDLKVDTLFNNDKLVYVINTAGVFNQIRGLKIIVRNNIDEIEYFHTIADKNLIVRNLDELEKYDIYIDLVYTTDGKNNESLNLFKMEIDGYLEYNIGSIEKTKDTDSEFNFNIHFKDNNFMLSNNQNLIYENIRINNNIYYIIGILGAIIAFSIIYIIRIKPKWLRK